MRILALVLALCACQVDALFRPARYQLVAPPAVYATWWAETSECVGIRADFARVGWGVMEDDSLGAFWADDIGPRIQKRHILTYGLWVEPHLILLSRSQVQNEWVVRHEMIHDLIQSPEHGAAFPRACTGLDATSGQ